MSNISSKEKLWLLGNHLSRLSFSSWISFQPNLHWASRISSCWESSSAPASEFQCWSFLSHDHLFTARSGVGLGWRYSHSQQIWKPYPLTIPWAACRELSVQVSPTIVMFPYRLISADGWLRVSLFLLISKTGQKCTCTYCVRECVRECCCKNKSHEAALEFSEGFQLLSLGWIRFGAVALQCQVSSESKYIWQPIYLRLMLTEGMIDQYAQ